MVGIKAKISKTKVFILVRVKKLISFLLLLGLAKFYKNFFNKILLEQFIYSRVKNYLINSF